MTPCSVCPELAQGLAQKYSGDQILFVEGQRLLVANDGVGKILLGLSQGAETAPGRSAFGRHADQECVDERRLVVVFGAVVAQGHAFDVIEDLGIQSKDVSRGFSAVAQLRHDFVEGLVRQLGQEL